MANSPTHPLLLEGDVGPAGGAGGVHDHRGHAHAANPLHLVHRHLRGRYHIAAPLGAVLAIVCSVAGYFGAPPIYRSQGLVDIAPTIPSVLRGDNQPVMAGFEAFVAQQRAFLENRRVLDRAVEDEAMRRVGWPAGPEGVTQLQKRLEVSFRRGDRIIVVAVEHKNPAMAQAAVNAVLKSYEELFGEKAGMTAGVRETLLSRRETELTNQIATLNRELLNQGEQFGTEDMIVRLHESKIGELDRLEKQINAVETELTTREARGEDEGSPAAPTMNYDALAVNDIDFARMLNHLRAVESQYEANALRFGPSHPEQRRLERAVAAAKADVEKKASGIVAAGGGPTGIASKIATPKLRELLERNKRERAGVAAEASELSRKRMQIRQRTEQIVELSKRLNETQKYLDELRAETKVSQGGRVSIAASGDLPVDPSTDRRIPLAVAGAMGGMGLGFGMVLVLGLIRPKYRYIDDLEASVVSAPLLGTLPELGAGDGEHDELAANSVHHLRNMLALSPFSASQDCTVYTITSAAPGDGKTSMALALGMSFAASGQRTLMIDADLYGRGLTKSLNMRGAKGLTDAAISGTLNGELRSTEYHNVWALAAGTCDPSDSTVLSKDRVARILKEIRQQFDVVVVDTGPILGSVEGNLLAALSDGVVLMVSRGQDSKLVRACLKRLGSIGARCAGMVFNRATRVDFEHSMSHTSLRSRRQLAGDEADEARRLDASKEHAPDTNLLRALSGGAVRPGDEQTVTGGEGGRTT